MRGKSARLSWLRHCASAIFLLAVAMGGLPAQEEPLEVTDWGLVSGFQDYWDNHFRFGRSSAAEDFDRDGWVDFFIGNPGDESFIFRNLGPAEDGIVRFAVDQVIFWGEIAFSASGADYDADGDLDLFIGCGGLEGKCLDYLLRNDSTPGRIHFTDVSEVAGIRGPGRGEPVPGASTGGVWGDYDRDGDQDLFVSVRDIAAEAVDYKSVLWRNNGDGTFTDVTVRSNLAYYYAPTRAGAGLQIRDFGTFQFSSWIDIDNDLDLDLFINNEFGPNILCRNLLVESGSPLFEDVTLERSLPGEDLQYPLRSFASTVADFNNDGWQDLISFTYFSEPFTSPYGNGNGLFLNQSGEGFHNVAGPAGINIGPGEPEIAMGCQVADWNADGFPDLAIGAGNPKQGTENRLLLSGGLVGDMPVFDDASHLINFEPESGIDPTLPPYPEIPPYPYRTHAMVAADVDRDGHLEMGVINGAMAISEFIAREPNRLFHFSGPGLGNTFRVRLRGNGSTDSTDAIGARAYIEIPGPAGPRRVFQTVLGGSAFSALNELTLTFGLGTDEAVSRLAVMWSSGCLQVLDDPAGGSPLPLALDQDCRTCPGAPGPVEAWLAPDVYGCAEGPSCELAGTVLDVEGPVAGARVFHRHGEPAQLTVEARSGPGGLFSLEHRIQRGTCVTEVLEPFGYLPASNPVDVRESRPGPWEIEVELLRGPEAHWPKSAGYWRHQIRSLISERGRPRSSQSEVEDWLGAIRARYPGLAGFASLNELLGLLEPAPAHDSDQRLRRELAATLLNLASGRLALFTHLRSGGQVGDRVEETYLLLTTTGAEPVQAERLANHLEELNEGSSLP